LKVDYGLANEPLTKVVRRPSFPKIGFIYSNLSFLPKTIIESLLQSFIVWKLPAAKL